MAVTHVQKTQSLAKEMTFCALATLVSATNATLWLRIFAAGRLASFLCPDEDQAGEGDYKEIGNNFIYFYIIMWRGAEKATSFPNHT